MNESKTPVRIHCVTGETESASQPGSVALDAPRDAGDPESGSKPALVAVAPSGELDWELDIIEGRKNLCCERFPRLKWFVRSEWYLFFMCLFVIAQTSVSVGMTSGALSTIERRYNLSGEEVGFIASTCKCISFHITFTNALILALPSVRSYLFSLLLLLLLSLPSSR